MSTIRFQFSRNPILRVLPAFLMMVAIFLFSARSSLQPQLDLLNRAINKAGHVIGYTLLGLSYWRAFGFTTKKRWLIWLLAVLYALTDEYHQSFVPGRHSTLFDVAVYDNAGALISLWISSRLIKLKQPVRDELVVEHAKG